MSSTSGTIAADDSSATVGRTAAGKRKEAEADADADVVAGQTTQKPKATSGQAVAAAQETQTGDEGVGGDDSPGAGFWRAGFGGSILDAVSSAALYQLYAVLVGLLVAEVFVFHIVFRLSLSFVTRMVLMSVAQLYYPVLALSNSVVFTVLFATRHNLSRLEGALSSVADAVTAPLIRAMPTSAVTGVSLDDLRERMLLSSRRVAQAEAPVTTNGWYGKAGWHKRPRAWCCRLRCEQCFMRWRLGTRQSSKRASAYCRSEPSTGFSAASSCRCLWRRSRRRYRCTLRWRLSRRLCSPARHLVSRTCFPMQRRYLNPSCRQRQLCDEA
jgi:hypothetical protein